MGFIELKGLLGFSDFISQINKTWIIFKLNFKTLISENLSSRKGLSADWIVKLILGIIVIVIMIGIILSVRKVL